MGALRRLNASSTSSTPSGKTPAASNCASCKGKQRQSTSKAANNDVWVQCDREDCREWSHWDCVGTGLDDIVDSIEKWYCTKCIDKSKRRGNALEIVYKEQPRKTTRKVTKLNYANIDSGLEGDPSRWIAVAESRPIKPHNFRRLKGEELTLDWIMNDPTALLEPILVESPEGLDMRMPKSSMTVQDVAKVVGTETPVEVMDVASQNGLQGWTLGRWAEYFHDPERSKIRNVISLEVSDTKLSKSVIPPKVVRDIDWIETVWPPEFKRVGHYPKVQKYCLMSVANCWTDWHIDFAASSVYYHILSGGKTFFFIRPTPENLHKYEKWSGDSNKQEQEWLGDSVDAVYRVDLVAGNTMIIPSGWIHSVWTPADSLVFGGNFLHSLNIGTQLRVHEIEKKTKVPMKYRFPYFITMLWFVCDHYLALLDPPESTLDVLSPDTPADAKPPLHPELTNRILTGLKFLSIFLLEQASRFAEDSEATADEKRIAAKNLPQLIVDPQYVARRFRGCVLAALGEKETLDLSTAEGMSAGIPKKRKAPPPAVLPSEMYASLSGPVPAGGAKFKNFEPPPAAKKVKTEKMTNEVTEQREPITTESKGTAARPALDGVEDGEGEVEEVEVKTLKTETRVTRVVRGAKGKVVRERRTVTTVVERMMWADEVTPAKAKPVEAPASKPKPVVTSNGMNEVKPTAASPSPLTWRNELSTAAPKQQAPSYALPMHKGHAYMNGNAYPQYQPPAPALTKRNSALPPPPSARSNAAASPTPNGRQWQIPTPAPSTSYPTPQAYPYYPAYAPTQAVPSTSAPSIAPPAAQEYRYPYAQPHPAAASPAAHYAPQRATSGGYGIPAAAATWSMPTQESTAR